MRSQVIRCVATHGIGLLIGVGCYFVFSGPSPSADPPHPSKSEHRTSRRVAGVSVLAQRALEKRIAQWGEGRWVADPDYGEKTVRQLGLDAIGKQSEHEKEILERVAKAKLRSARYREVADLERAVYDALLTWDWDAGPAIFLEWYRRDPAGAFDALNANREWLNYTTSNSIFAYLVPEKELWEQAMRLDRSEDFQESARWALALKWGFRDDLTSLVAAMGQVDEEARESLSIAFISEWVPDDGVHAAKVIAEGMPLESRKIFLAELASSSYGRGMCGMGPVSPRPVLPFSAWTDEFSSALLVYELGVPEELSAELRDRAASTHMTKDDLFEFKGSEDKGLEIGLSTEDAMFAMRWRMENALVDQKDYPELFGSEELGLGDVAVAMRQRIEGLDPYPKELARVLYSELGARDPQQAVNWARTQMDADTLQSETVELLPALVRAEPRTDRIVELLRMFQPEYQVSGAWSDVSGKIFDRFDTWVQLDPEAAANAIDRIDPEHPIFAHGKWRERYE